MAAAFRAAARADQDATLAAVGAGAPVYRWTTALNGYAVRLTPAQARLLGTLDRGGRRRARRRTPPGHGPDERRPRPTADLPLQGGAGVVIGLVDSGLWPDSPLFADVRGLGRAARDYRGHCASGPGWGPEVCDRKIVGAQWFVDGFGADRVRSSTRLSPLDDDGHGTLMASIAAGNAGVDVRIPGQRAGSYAGAAPQARLAVYKACWTAPDPRDDGCSTADLVTAVDRAVADRVDVLNVSVDGPTMATTAVPASTSSSARCSALPRPTSSSSAHRATAAPTGTPPTPRRGSPPSAAPPAPRVAARWSRPASVSPAPWPRATRRGPLAWCWARGRPPPGRRRRSRAAACRAASTRPGCPDASWCANAAASAGSTSPRPCTAPTAPGWCSSTPAAAR